MPPDLVGLLWLILLLGPLLFIQHNLHREIQALYLLITRRADVAMVLFSISFFPGILLHEASHYLVARILGVRTGRFSLIPRPLEKGKLQLGFVETQSTDWLRDALIGSAPLLSGGLFVAYAGWIRLGLPGLWQAYKTGSLAGLTEALGAFSLQSDFWLWFYLTLVVSSTMLPSESDRRAWLPLGFILGSLLITSLAFGAGPWLSLHLAMPLNRILLAVDLVLGVSVLVHLMLLPPLWLVRHLLSRLLRLRVVL
jgi:membrane-associated protease RseP (regulator of RpoE activity)